jgi:integrase
MWSPVFKDRASAVSWDGHEAKAEKAVRAIRRAGPTFGDVALDSWALVEAGTYARRRGRSKQLSDTTVADYRAVLLGAPRRREDSKEAGSLVLIERCGRRPIAALDDAYWQSLVDELVSEGKSYSRIATYLAVIRHVYAYAMRANRRIVPTDPTREVAMPANDGKIRDRVATAEDAARLIEALPAAGASGALSWDAVLEIRASGESAVALGQRFGVSDALVGKVRRGELYKTAGSRRSAVASDRPGWALSFYTGMRRSEIGRSEWQHVFWDADEIIGRRIKERRGGGAARADGRPAEEDPAGGVDPSRPARHGADRGPLGWLGEVAGSCRPGLDAGAAIACDAA